MPEIAAAAETSHEAEREGERLLGFSLLSIPQSFSIAVLQPDSPGSLENTIGRG